MINCFIIGQLDTIDVLQNYISKFPLTELRGYCSNFFMGLNIFQSEIPRLVFVDTALMDEHQDLLLQLATQCAVVYVSKSCDQSLDAFELFALDYLLMPVTFERFEQSIGKLLRFSSVNGIQAATGFGTPRESFLAKTDEDGQKEYLITCSEVLVIEAFQNKVNITMVNDKKFLCHNTMKEMEECLPATMFLRVHKSFIVNLTKVTAVEGNYIYLKHNEDLKILVGNTYRKSFYDWKNPKMLKKNKIYARSHYPGIASISLLLLKLFDYYEPIGISAIFMLSNS